MLPSVTKNVVRNERLADWLRAAMAAEGLTLADLDRALPMMERGAIGTYVRGERVTYAPEDVNRICRRIGVRVERFLNLAGFDVALTPESSVDVRLAEFLGALPPEKQRGMLGLLQALAATLGGSR